MGGLFEAVVHVVGLMPGDALLMLRLLLEVPLLLSRLLMEISQMMLGLLLGSDPLMFNSALGAMLDVDPRILPR